MTKKTKHRLKSFKDVSHLFEDAPLATVAEALKSKKKKSKDGFQETDLNISSVALPYHLDYETKLERLSMLADTITSIENSDVLVVASWVTHPEAPSSSSS